MADMAFRSIRSSHKWYGINFMASTLISYPRFQRSVYANYPAFIRTSKEISDLEGELSSIRNLLSTQATLIHGLADGVNIDDDKVSDESLTNGLLNFEDNEVSDLEKWAAEFPDHLDALLAERRVDEALAAFDEGEIFISQANEKHTLSSSVLSSLQYAIAERKQKLADQLAKAACQPSTRGRELRSAIVALKRLGDGPRAHTVLLDAHFRRYQYPLCHDFAGFVSRTTSNHQSQTVASK